MNIFEELQWRGLVSDCTDATAVAERLTKPITLYCGFDPTSDSLHVGSLVPLLALRRFQLAGHHPIAVAGGATGSIGDPSGKTAERQLLTKEQITANITAVKPQLARLLDFDSKANPARLVDNADWTAGMSYLDFLRDIGKHFTVNMMVAKESVRARMEDREVGISYTEFSYMLLQAFDFYVLCRDFGCELQIGGADQWGNITAGIDLIRKKLGRRAFGLTLPLITKADGTKFGKTESGTVWLDERKTRVEDFYQFWIRTDDRDVIRYLKYFTFLTREEIAELEKKHAQKPEAREAHKALADAIKALVHPRSVGVAHADGTKTPTDPVELTAEIIYQKSLEEYREADFENLVKFGHSKEIERSEFAKEDGIHLAKLLVRAGLSQSTGQAKKDIADGGIRVGSMYEKSPGQPPSLRQVINYVFPVKAQHLIFGRYLLLRKGKRNYVVVTAK
ncbi:MAG: tyrosine--tRNA ligase [Verrucomicrobia bacterium]|nr:tyrosine--tRNA ligase [Verrucomicrobiota bacterium]